MNKTASDKLSERLERLERECQGLRREMRWWRLAGVTVPLIVLLLVAIGGAQNPTPPPPNFGGPQKAAPQSIDAEQIRIVGKDGKARAILGVKDGVTALVMKDGQGDSRIAFVVYENGTSGLALIDSTGVQRLGLSLTNEGPSITLRDPRGRDCLGFGASENAVGVNILKYYDRSATNVFLGIGGGMARLTIGELDEAQLKAFLEKKYAPHPKHSLRLGVSDKEGPFLHLLDRSGVERMQLSVTDVGKSSIELRDAKQTSRVGLSTNSQGESRIFLREKDQLFLIPPLQNTDKPKRDKGA
jgi:hypothetical protein